MAYDEGLSQRIEEIFDDLDHPLKDQKKMFGGVCFLLGGNMACGVHKDKLIVRVGPEQYQPSLAKPHTAPFDITGRPMKGWVMVAAEGIEADEDLKRWVNGGVTFARSLPPK